jgi:uncharacterized protein (DUF2062 family)
MELVLVRSVQLAPLFSPMEMNLLVVSTFQVGPWMAQSDKYTEHDLIYIYGKLLCDIWAV